MLETTECPNCQSPVSQDMVNCPKCGLNIYKAGTKSENKSCFLVTLFLFIIPLGAFSTCAAISSKSKGADEFFGTIAWTLIIEGISICVGIGFLISAATKHRKSKP